MIKVQWKLSVKDTLGPQFYSLLQRFPQFRGVLIHYSTIYTGTQNGVLIIEVSTFQRFVIEISPCIDLIHVGSFCGEKCYFSVCG